MSYTHVDVVRHHLAPLGASGEAVYDQMVVVPADGAVRFFSGEVAAESVVVKSVRDGQRVRRQLQLSGDQVAVVSGPVVPGTVVVASDSSLGTVYVENRDYVIEHSTGMLTVKPGGDMTAGMTVVVWCLPYVVYQRSVDYALNATKAELVRLSGGGMIAGELVWVDYRPVYDDYTDELIAQAVTEANATVAAEVDPSREFGTDPLLQVAATYRALAAVARSTAGRRLGSVRGTGGQAQAWLTLAGQYAERADQLLRSFRPPFENPAVLRRS